MPTLELHPFDTASFCQALPAPQVEALHLRASDRLYWLGSVMGDDVSGQESFITAAKRSDLMFLKEQQGIASGMIYALIRKFMERGTSVQSLLLVQQLEHGWGPTLLDVVEIPPSIQIMEAPKKTGQVQLVESRLNVRDAATSIWHVLKGS